MSVRFIHTMDVVLPVVVVVLERIDNIYRQLYIFSTLPKHVVVKCKKMGEEKPLAASPRVWWTGRWGVC